MDDFKATFGLIVLGINICTIVLICSGIVLRFRSGVNSRYKKELDYHFKLLLVSVVFLIANSIALYTGIKAWLVNPYYMMDELVIWRFVDRFTMLLTAIGILVLGHHGNPFDIDELERKGNGRF